MNFNCTISSPYRTCVLENTNLIAKEFIGSSYKICEFDPWYPSDPCRVYELGINDIPYPILSSEFTPSTKGGVEYLKGIYILFGVVLDQVYNFKSIRLKGNTEYWINPSIIGDPWSKSFDPTNIAINYRGGCGTSAFVWYGTNKEYQFNHAKPVIDYVEVKGLTLHITGNNFCNNTHINNITVMVDGTSYSPDSIDHQLVIINITKQQQTTFQEGKSNASITVYGVLSNVQQISTVFKVKRNQTSTLSNNGQIIEYTLYNINAVNQNLTSIITINDGRDLTITGKLIQDNSVSTTKSKQTFNFNIPPGCGKKQITISIGNQTEKDELVYQSPSVTNCTITSSNEMVECNGNFIDFKSFYSNSRNSDKVEIKLSNTSIQNEININNTTLSFKLKDEYVSSNLEMCGIAITFIEIPPTISKHIDTSITLNQKGGNITITGNHFNQAIIENTYFQCENDIIKSKVNCQYESNSILICPYTLVGPKDVKCNFILNGKDTNHSTTIIYQVHTVLNVTNQITASKGGVITIIGDQFYDSIDNITINEVLCESPEYHNETIISCLMPSLNDDNKTPLIVYVEVTINGKSNRKNLLVYLDYPLSSNGNLNVINFYQWKLILIIIMMIITLQ